MRILHRLAHSLQRLFGPELGALAADTKAIERRREFDAVTLLQMLVLTVLRTSRPTPTDFQRTADQLGVHVSRAAVRKRFTDELIAFLKAALERTVAMALAAEPATLDLLRGFTAVLIGDATSLTLPDDYAEEFPGCGGTASAGRAAMKIQVLWDFLTGALQRLVIEPGKNSDATSPIASADVPAGSLSLFDLGYFCLDRFRGLIDRGAHFISRLQINTAVFAPDGRELPLLDYLQGQFRAGRRLIDMPILLGAAHRLSCRLIAVRVPREEAARRRQKAHEKAAKHGRAPSEEYLLWQEWTIFVTDCAPERLTWKAVVVLYRARWQIELMFKIWKSHNGLGEARPGAPAPERLATIYATLIGVVVQHWILVASTWNRACRSLMKAAKRVRDWVTNLIEAWDDPEHLLRVLTRLAEVLQRDCVERRGKHPSLFQLLDDPELLDWKT